MVDGGGRVVGGAVALILALTLAVVARPETAASFSVGEYHGPYGSKAYISVSDDIGPYLMLVCDYGFRAEKYAGSGRLENRLIEPPFKVYLRTDRFFDLEQPGQILRFRFRVGDLTYEAFSNRAAEPYIFWTKVSLPFEGMRNLYKIKSSVDVFELIDLPGSARSMIDFRSGNARSAAERVSEMCRQKNKTKYDDYAVGLGTVVDASTVSLDGEPALWLYLTREGSSLSVVCRMGKMPKVWFTPVNVDFFNIDRVAAVLDFGMPQTEPLSSGALGLTFYIPSRGPEETSRLGNAATVKFLTKLSNENTGTWQMRMTEAEPGAFYDMLNKWEYVEVMSDVSLGASGGIEKFALQGLRNEPISNLVREHCRTG